MGRRQLLWSQAMRTIVDELKWLFLPLILVPALAFAVPAQIPYTGQLTESGSPVTGTRDLTVSLYTDSLGGSPVYSETFNGVTVTGGVFQLNLNPDQSVWDGSTQWLAVSVNGGAELAPRVRIGTVPYAASVGSVTTIHHYSIHSSAFIPFNINNDINYNDQYVCVQAGDTHLLAPVQLPDGAHITGWSVCARFDGAGGAITDSHLFHRDATAAGPAFAIASASLSGSGGVNQCSDFNGSYTVDNSAEVYFVRISINQSNGCEVKLLSIRVHYTLSDPHLN
jgi:hypothetical protein